LRSARLPLRQIHRWSGLVAALLFLLQAVTGILWSNQEVLTSVFHAEARSQATSRRAPLDDLLGAISAQAPGATLDRIAFPRDHHLPLTVRLVSPRSTTEVMLVDPSSATVLSAGPIWAYPEQFAEQLHGTLLAGAAGHWIVAFEGLVLVTMALSGLVIWWPGLARVKPALTLHVGGPPRRLLLESHRIPGVLAACTLLVTGVTGALMAAEPLTSQLVALAAPVGPEVRPVLPNRPAGPSAISAERALATVQARFPKGRLVKVSAMGPADRVIFAILVDTRSRNPMAYDMAGVDRATGALTVYADAAHIPAGDEAVAWLTPVHTGEIYGPLRPLIATGGGLVLMLIVLTGVANWAVRHRILRRRSTSPTLSPTRRL
jgi:uncharacterized iron-regulated membrane protein